MGSTTGAGYLAPSAATARLHGMTTQDRRRAACVYSDQSHQKRLGNNLIARSNQLRRIQLDPAIQQPTRMPAQYIQFGRIQFLQVGADR